MDETIEKLTTNITNAVSGFPWSQQAFMLFKIAELLESAADDCLMTGCLMDELDNKNKL
jgi:hypothetical protein